MTSLATQLSHAELEERLGQRPRVRLGTLPTPLEEWPRFRVALQEAVGRAAPRVLAKRDDLSGFALGGNKTRNLEYLVGEAIASGADCLVTGADVQSNQCRAVAAAAAKYGLDCYLAVAAGRHRETQGNLLLDHLFGAHVEIVEGVDLVGVQTHLDGVEQRLRDGGRTPYRITGQRPETAVKAMGGYLGCALEIDAQVQALALDAPERVRIVICAGSGTTQSALATGLKALGAPYRVTGIAVIGRAEETREKIVAYSHRCAALFDLPAALTTEEVDVRDEYAAPGYGVPSDASLDALRLVARSEGVVLDPVYTSKTVAGLMDLTRRGELGPDDTAVFVHTGGVPGLFAYAEELAPHLIGAQAGAASEEHTRELERTR